MRPNFLFEDEKSFDSLTKIYTRDVIVDYVNFLVAEGVAFSLAIVDIDNFKYVNDNFGHIAGDKVLVEVAGRIKNTIGSKGVVGRFGGDEFLIVFPEVVEYTEIWDNCHTLMKCMNVQEIKTVLGIYVTITMGISRFPENGHCYAVREQLLDKAMELLGVDSPELEITLDEMIRTEDVIKEEEAIYLPPFYFSETGCAKRLLRLLWARRQMNLDPEYILEMVEKSCSIAAVSMTFSATGNSVISVTRYC